MTTLDQNAERPRRVRLLSRNGFSFIAPFIEVGNGDGIVYVWDERPAGRPILALPAGEARKLASILIWQADAAEQSDGSEARA